MYIKQSDNAILSKKLQNGIMLFFPYGKSLMLEFITSKHNWNCQRDVTAWIGWQRSYHYHPRLAQQKRYFYKVGHLPELYIRIHSKMKHFSTRQ